MVSGRPARLAEARRRHRLLGVCLGLGLAAGLGLAGCASRESAFVKARATLDTYLRASPGSLRPGDLASAFAKAQGLARTSADWLSLLKRAKRSDGRGDRGRYLEVAQRVLAKAPTSPELALASADALLSAGLCLPVLELFDTRLRIEDEPALWASAFVEALRQAVLPEALQTPGNYARLAEISRDGHLYLDAASRALAQGDILGARAYLAKAADRGVPVPSELYWDAGLYATLAEGRKFSKASDLRLAADAAWLLGRPKDALALWNKALAADPQGSYRLYASLAAATGEGLDPEDSGVFDGQGNLGLGLEGEAMVSGRKPSASHVAIKPAFHDYFGKLHGLFPRVAGAEVLYAGALARAGLDKEALAYLESASRSPDPRVQRDRLRVGSSVWTGERLAAEAVKASAAFPRDPAILDEVLLILLSRRAYPDYLALLASAKARGVEPKRKDLYEAYGLLAQGHFDEAEASFTRAYVGADRGPQVDFALALLSEKAGDPAMEAEHLERALLLAQSEKERCAILKTQGGLAESSGDFATARLRYAAASAADPSDTEARRLSQR